MGSLVAQNVTVYKPFAHYHLLDFIRITWVSLAIASLAIILMFARMRWIENRRSATYFLLSLVGFIVEEIFVTIKGLGYPFTWILIARYPALGFAWFAVCRAVKEVGAGDWRKVDEYSK